MKVKFLGGTREVGRAAIAIKTERSKLLIDDGVIMNHEVGLPVHISPKEVDAILLTHCQ